MANSFFRFKQFTVNHDRSAMKVTTDGCLLGAWVAETVRSRQLEVGSYEQMRLLDVGAGTGLLSLMAAQKVAGKIDAIEIDPSASEQAAENVAASPWPDHISIVNTDVLQWQPNFAYDCIFSNPPFYENDLRSATDQKNIAHHDQGLKLSSLLSFIKNHLREDGRFFLLLPAKRERELEALFEQQGFCVQQKVWIKQTSKHQPFRLMIEGCFKKRERIVEETIVIKDQQDHYTPRFISLLKDYYLYL